jgi:DNA-binding CsgD family transcriptional regulator
MMTAVIEVRGLTKRYGGQAVVDDIAFHVDAGEIFGILGPNGAGKTTAVECMEGLRRRDSGQVRILGLDPLTDRHRLHQRIGVQLQESQLQEKLKVREALELYASFYPNPADWRELLERWGLAGKADARFARLLGQVRQPAREPLSQRELDILELIAQGCSNREAAARLFISEATVKTHVLHIYAKLGVNDRAAAVATGFERGLLPRP